MSKVVAIMSVPLDGYVADLNDGVAEVFDWSFRPGNVEFHTGGAIKNSRSSTARRRCLSG